MADDDPLVVIRIRRSQVKAICMIEMSEWERERRADDPPSKYIIRWLDKQLFEDKKDESKVPILRLADLR